MDELKGLINKIHQTQEEMNKNMDVALISDRWSAASRRARVLSVELGKLYKEYRALSVKLSTKESD